MIQATTILTCSANPYASWERGANENMNGLIRQFFPKKMTFDAITSQDISFAMDRLTIMEVAATPKDERDFGEEGSR